MGTWKYWKLGTSTRVTSSLPIGRPDEWLKRAPLRGVSRGKTLFSKSASFAFCLLASDFRPLTLEILAERHNFASGVEWGW